MCTYQLSQTGYFPFLHIFQQCDELVLNYCLFAIFNEVVFLPIPSFFLSGCSDRQEGNGDSSETVRKAQSQSQSGTQLGEFAGP